MRLGRIVAELMPSEGEVHGLVSLMEIQASRLRARVNAAGEPILLLEQDRARWDRLLIQRGLVALERATASSRGLGPYALQASIAACHARARSAEETDWIRIAALYDALAQVMPSPVVELNRAVAVMMAFGAAAGLELVDALIASRHARRLSPVARRARRHAGEARPAARGARRVRARRVAHAQRTRAGDDARAGGRMPLDGTLRRMMRFKSAPRRRRLRAPHAPATPDFVCSCAPPSFSRSCSRA